MLVSHEDVVNFQKDGVVCLRDVFALDWIEELARGVTDNFKDPGPDATQYTAKGEPGGFYDDYCNWTRIPEYKDFVLNSPAGEIAATLLESNEIRINHEHVLVKEPGTNEKTPWHHDLPYYGLSGTQLCSIWLPLDSVPRSACPEFVAGSHRWNKQFVPRLFVSHQNYAPVQGSYEQVPDIDANRDQYDIKRWSLEPGDCIVFHMLTLHGAPGTSALSNRRRGFSTRWMGDDAVFATRPWPTSPPFKEVDLKPGDPMIHPSFPVVYSV